MKRFLYALVLWVLIFFSGLMLWITLPYFQFHSDTDFLITKQKEYGIWLWRIAFYVHISLSLLVIPCGIFQYSKRIIRKHLNWHKRCGKIYAYAVLFFSAPSGLIMAYHANGGWPAKISFLLLSILWWATTLIGVLRIQKKDYAAHFTFMTYSYALALSAIMLRLYALILPWISDLRGAEAYITLAWTSWVPNVLVAAWFIKKNSAASFMAQPESIR